MKQKSLFKLKDYTSEFGGSILEGKRKSRRPFSNKKPIKIVLKASAHSLFKQRREVERLFFYFAKKFHVKLYEVAVCSNHSHFVAKFDSELSYARFIRALTGTMARKFQIKFLFRPWSRILKWGKALQVAIQYTIQNRLETEGVIPYQVRLYQT